MYSKEKHMNNDPLFWIVTASCLLVLVILMIGVISFSRGGEFNRKYSNRLMRYRIYAQAVAVIMILIYIVIRGRGL